LGLFCSCPADIILALVSFPDTQLRLTKIMAAWNHQALVSALSAQQAGTHLDDH
jgi:hypothetical protein